MALSKNTIRMLARSAKAEQRWKTRESLLLVAAKLIEARQLLHDVACRVLYDSGSESSERCDAALGNLAKAQFEVDRLMGSAGRGDDVTKEEG